ncbi:MAG: LysM domain-containing protein [Planctomycetota bacterium]|nr:LysM domain-containing protein [Planctomycetota bacterium]
MSHQHHKKQNRGDGILDDSPEETKPTVRPARPTRSLSTLSREKKVGLIVLVSLAFIFCVVLVKSLMSKPGPDVVANGPSDTGAANTGDKQTTVNSGTGGNASIAPTRLTPQKTPTGADGYGSASYAASDMANGTSARRTTSGNSSVLNDPKDGGPLPVAPSVGAPSSLTKSGASVPPAAASDPFKFGSSGGVPSAVATNDSNKVASPLGGGYGINNELSPAGGSAQGKQPPDSTKTAGSSRITGYDYPDEIKKASSGLEEGINKVAGAAKDGMGKIGDLGKLADSTNDQLKAGLKDATKAGENLQNKVEGAIGGFGSGLYDDKPINGATTIAPAVASSITPAVAAATDAAKTTGVTSPFDRTPSSSGSAADMAAMMSRPTNNTSLPKRPASSPTSSGMAAATPAAKSSPAASYEAPDRFTGGEPPRFNNDLRIGAADPSKTGLAVTSPTVTNPAVASLAATTPSTSRTAPSTPSTSRTTTTDTAARGSTSAVDNFDNRYGLSGGSSLPAREVAPVAPARTAAALAQSQHFATDRVRNGDTYWTIAERNYKSGSYFKALYEHQRRNLSTAAAPLVPNTDIEIPTVEELHSLYPDLCPKVVKASAATTQVGLSGRTANGETVYTVAQGDTLYEIARKQLGQANRWAEIRELNKSTLGGDLDHVPPGTKLILPARGDATFR